MPVRIYKPTNPARRKSSVADFSNLTKKQPEKKLREIRKRTGGRNNQGKITVRHRGGGAKRFYRIIDFKRSQFDIPANVTAIEYDPNRSARIALLRYENGHAAYMIAPADLHVGDTVVSSQGKIDIKSGNRLSLEHIPTGITVHAIEMQPGHGAQVVRSAGMGAQVVAFEDGFAHLRLPSGEVRKFSGRCMATIGSVGNPDHQNIRWGKAGRMRLRGWRPSVRGKAMNPVDHPHGGGEGNQPVGLRHPKTPQGKPALGVLTRKKKKASNKFILKRRT
ncbi:50S ribosomal protein L2 [Candidatus Uhrbacteria bacterium]|nr:50S ribosomal protein L2 [Candidatus Uhrbacteria bacterium]